MNWYATLLAAALLSASPALAESSPLAKAKPMPAPRPSTSSREVRRNAATRGGKPTTDESVTQVPLGGQCGFAGCSSSTLVAFTYRTRGANPATNAVLVLVSCESVPTIPCTAVRAEVRATSSPNPTQ